MADPGPPAKRGKKGKNYEIAQRKKEKKAEARRQAQLTTQTTPTQVSKNIYDGLHNSLCQVCGNGGDLICCSNCTLVFHLQCTVPPLSTIPDGDWYCCFCVAYGSGTHYVKKADREQAKEHVLSMHETSKNMVPLPNNGIIRKQPSVPSNLSTNQQQNKKQPSMLPTLSQKVPNNNQPMMLSPTANKEPSNNQPSMLPILLDNVPNNKQSSVLPTLPSLETIETNKRPIPNIELNSSSSKSARIYIAQISPQSPQLIDHGNTNDNRDISDFVESFFQKDKNNAETNYSNDFG